MLRHEEIAWAKEIVSRRREGKPTDNLILQVQEERQKVIRVQEKLENKLLSIKEKETRLKPSGDYWNPSYQYRNVKGEIITEQNHRQCITFTWTDYFMQTVGMVKLIKDLQDEVQFQIQQFYKGQSNA